MLASYLEDETEIAVNQAHLRMILVVVDEKKSASTRWELVRLAWKNLSEAVERQMSILGDGLRMINVVVIVDEAESEEQAQAHKYNKWHSFGPKMNFIPGRFHDD